ncbi:hypothetical protein PIB30_108536 [Stylosanthes scabra]|uniref:Uncharacterized protein n=1 Tax=Stylosanthes scabra TaxID=79078 RepID=A0ABU6V0C1_9FABA|nr:hypothetical protein [Stylosanthes scabra]
MHRIPSELCSEACLGESSTRMGDLLGSPLVAPLFQYLFFTCPSGRRPSSRKLGSGWSGIRKGGAPWRGDGPREASLRRRRCPRRRAYDDCVRIHLQVRSYQHTSFLPVLPAADPRPGSSAPAGLASGRAGLHGEEMGPARPLGGGAVALGGALMKIVCAYIGRCDHTSTNAPDPIRTPQLSVLGRE